MSVIHEDSTKYSKAYYVRSLHHHYHGHITCSVRGWAGLKFSLKNSQSNPQFVYRSAIYLRIHN